MKKKEKLNFLCRNIGHILAIFTDGKLLVKHKCIFCPYYIRTFMGFEPKLKFRGFEIFKESDNELKNIVKDINL